MENFKLEVNIGGDFNSTSSEAKRIATKISDRTEFVKLIDSSVKLPIVEFDFNGVKCLVDKETNLEYLWRDYMNSWTMGWKSVGPNCVAEYDRKTQSKLTRLTKIKQEKQAREDAEYRNKEDIEKELFNSKTEGIELELKDVDGWNKCRETNSDSYGKATLDYAEGWAKLMQYEIYSGNKLVDIAGDTSFQLGFMGISGAMYGFAVSILSQCWVNGEELCEWHNKKYNHDGDGVVNPVVLSIV